MTGKFHKSWGEFGGFKNPVALRYEMAQIMSLGCLPCVGDQLHPDGVMDVETYRIIGEAYQEVEAREPWLVGAHPVADVAVISPSAVMNQTTREDESESGACRMLMEAHIPHAVVDDAMDFSRFSVLILPDQVPVGDSLREKLEKFLEGGGALLMSGASGIDPQTMEFAVDVGARFDGLSPWDVEYIKTDPAIGEGLVSSPFLVYDGGVVLDPVSAEVLAEIWKPYFNRTYLRFCSHRNTPPEGPAGWPAVIRKGRIIHISSPIFAVYNSQGMQLHRDLVLNLLDLLYPNPLAEVKGLPSCGRVSIMRQEDPSRLMVHLIYANPIRRGETEVIEDIVPLHEVELKVRVEKAPSRVYLAPSEETLGFTHKDGVVTVVIPRLEMAAIVVLEE
jgi:hypothetical protein